MNAIKRLHRAREDEVSAGDDLHALASLRQQRLAPISASDWGPRRLGLIAGAAYLIVAIIGLFL